MAELLLDKGYQVFGLVRKSSFLGHIRPFISRITLIEGDLTDQISLDSAISRVQPDELYNLAAQSSVAESWNDPVLTADVNAVGVLRLLESVHKHSPRTKFLQASSSEMLAGHGGAPQNENTELHPRNPYGAAKAFAHYNTISYRETGGIFACSCICFSHESPRRGHEFVTRKVTEHVARIKLGLAGKLKIGNLHARRDWGYAGDTVRAMWMILQQPAPDDYVIATGETHSVGELLEIAFAYLGLSWKEYVEVDPALFRPEDAQDCRGDASKARQTLGWKAEVGFRQLIEMMVNSDLAFLSGIREDVGVGQAKAGV